MPDDSRRDASASDHAQTCCKAGRVATKYDALDVLNGTLANRWAAADGPGLRTLAEQFNKTLLERALIESGDPPLDGEVDVIYDQLTTDGDSSRVDRRLEANDVDPNALRDDFISYKTIDRHFKTCIDRERETAEPMTKADAIDRLRALNRRVEKVAAKTLEEVDAATSVGFEDPDVSASVTVVCSACGKRKSFTAAVRDGCACGESDFSRADEQPSREAEVTDTDDPVIHE